MKKLISILFIALFNVFVFAQNPSDDVKARIGMYVELNPDIFSVEVNSNEAKAIVLVITKSFENYMVVPDVSLNGFQSGQERIAIQNFQNVLRNLIANPPTWDDLVQQQNQILTQPPTPPVYAGDDKAHEFYNSKYAGKSRASTGKTPVRIEQETVIEEPVPDPPKRTE